MSAFQYYEFQAIDRPLGQRQISELRRFSSRATITPTRFLNTYAYGPFRGNARRWMEKYFDAFLHLSNWGSHALTLRLPAGTLDVKVAQRYCRGPFARASAKRGHVLVEFTCEEEESEWLDEEEAEGLLSTLLPVRADLAAGDLRALYLIWLTCLPDDEVDDDACEPPVPPGLGTLSPALRALAEFLDVAEDLIEVAAERSPALDLPRKRGALQRRLSRSPIASESAPRRTVGELRAAALARGEARETRAARFRAQATARRRRADEKARSKLLEHLARRGEAAWHDVDALVMTKQQRAYDEAAKLVVALKALAERNGQASAFLHHIRRINHQHASKQSMLRRLADKGISVSALKAAMKNRAAGADKS